MAAAINDDANYNSTLTTALATKLPLAGGTMTGNISHASNFTLDVGGDIYLDADGGDIDFRDGGATFGRITNSSLDFVISSVQDNEDIIFKGVDGGSAITALTLDMSNAGAAAFNYSLLARNEIWLNSTDNSKTIGYLYDSSDNFVIRSYTGDKDIIFRGNDGGSVITALTLDMSSAGQAIFNASVVAQEAYWINSGGNTVGYLYNDSNDLVIRSYLSDEDIIFKGNDGGSLISALTLDMSDAGHASFNNHITAAGNIYTAGNVNLTVDNKKIRIGAGEDLQLYHDGSNSHIVNDYGVLYIDQNQNDGNLVLRCDNMSGGLHDYFYLDGGSGSIKGKAIRDIEWTTTATNSTAGHHIFKSYNTEIMRIDGGNNRVGIGQPTPTEALHIKTRDAGASIRLEQFDTSGAPTANDVIGSIEWSINDDSYNSGADTVRARIQAVVENTTSATGLQFWAGDSSAAIAERMRILPNGNVGIGITTPDNVLHVREGDAGGIDSHGDAVVTIEGSNNIALQFLTPNTRTQSIFFGDVQDNAHGIIRYDHPNTRLQMGADGAADTLTIDAGKVGIGTASPGYPIHVESSVAGDWMGKIKNTHATNGYGLLIHAGDDASVKALSVGNYAGTGDYLVVRGDGNVGIGTASPSEKLHVTGAAKIDGNLYLATGSNTPYIVGGTVSTVFRNNANNASLLTIANDGTISIAGAANLQGATDQTGVFRSNSTMSISGGSGYFAPAASLHVRQSSADDNDTALILETTDDGERTRAIWKHGHASSGNGAIVLNYYGFSMGWDDDFQVINIGRGSNNVGFGLGNTQPTQNLDIAGDVRIGDARSLFFKRHGDNYAWRMRNESASDANTYGFDGSNDLVFEVVANSNAEATPTAASHTIYGSSGNTLVLKESGRVGVGTNQPAQKFHVSAGHMRLDTGYSLLWDDTHERIEQSNGKLEFFTNNGEAMTLSGSYLGIGTTTPTNCLVLSASSGETVPNKASTILYVTGGNAAGKLSGIGFGYHGGHGNEPAAWIGHETNTWTSYTNSDIIFATRDGTGNTAPTERMRITAAGIVQVGTTNTVNVGGGDANVVTDESFGINDGSNSANYKLDRINFNSGNYYVLNESSAGVRLVNGNTAWQTQSDETLKENIIELTDVLPKVKDMRCVTYNLKSQSADSKKIGFIAQDWQGDFGQVIDADEDGTLGMRYTETIPVLLKAIQEQQEMIEILKDRIAALENN